MTIKDFFWLNDEEYAKRISDYTAERLQKQERIKGQQQVTALLATGSGIALTCVTYGCTLAVAGYAIRRHNVARRKYTLIQEELSSRKIELYVPQQRDFCIPLSAFTCGVCVGAGVGIGIHHVVDAATPALPIDPTGGTSAVSMMAVNPAGAAAGMTAGAAEGLKALVHPISAHVSNTLVSEGASYSSATVQEPLISEGVSYSLSSACAVDPFVLGYNDGMLGVHIIGITLERTTANVVSSATTDKALNKMVKPKEKKDELSLN